MIVIFPAGDHATKVMQPGDRSLDDPTAFVPTKFSAILRRVLAILEFTVWTNQINSLISQTVSQLLRIGRLVVDQSLGVPTLRCHGFNQRFDQNDFVAVGRSLIKVHCLSVNSTVGSVLDPAITSRPGSVRDRLGMRKPPFGEQTHANSRPLRKAF